LERATRGRDDMNNESRVAALPPRESVDPEVPACELAELVKTESEIATGEWKCMFRFKAPPKRWITVTEAWRASCSPCRRAKRRRRARMAPCRHRSTAESSPRP
jgi:hypothetical protein